MRRRSASVRVRRGVDVDVEWVEWLDRVEWLDCVEWLDAAEIGVETGTLGGAGDAKLPWPVSVLGHGGTTSGRSACSGCSAGGGGSMWCSVGGAVGRCSDDAG